jgi:TetR/AcrR family transcriptional regulator, cholesterol catabolism regulator
MPAKRVSTNKKPKGKAPGAPGGRRWNGEDRRRDREVLDVAANIFREKGYTETSVQDVANALGMLKGSLYYYIEKKEDLLFRLLDEVHDDADKILAEVSARDGLLPLESLRLYVHEQVLYNTKNLAKISVYYHDIDALSGERRKTILKRREPHERYVTDLIVAAQRSGAADPSGDARVLRNCVFATLIWVYRWYQPRARLNSEQVADLCADFVTHGVIGGPLTPPA